MSLNETPGANRVHIGFFGRTNAGKSSIVNAVTGQNLAVVSSIKGTTTDPVYKSMELLPLGAVMIIDTAGFDDYGDLGELRMKKTRQVLNKTDIAVLVVDALVGISDYDNKFIDLFREKSIPFIIVLNKCELLQTQYKAKENELYVSALDDKGIYELKETIARIAVKDDYSKKLVGDLLKANDFVILVTPIDEAAPKGRLILPQQQTIRDILDSHAVSIVVQEEELAGTISTFNALGKKPAMVITDSQAFKNVSALTPKDIPLTSFSILMARHKGFLETSVDGVNAIEKLNDGDTILIAEGCTHHKQCDDIGTVKIPRWLKEHTNKQLIFKSVSGTEFPDDLSPYALIVHCGGCMLNEREVRYRMKCALDQGVPITNYGILIAQMQGILSRSIEIFY